MSVLEFASLGSGSKGNATLVKAEDTIVMVDCGFTIKETEIRLDALGLSPEQISAVLVTHEHGDHIKGAAPFARRYKIPVYMTFGTARAKSLESHQQLKLICSHEPFKVGVLSIQPVIVPHDAQEPVQFVIQYHNRRLGILTDLGSFTPYVVRHYQQCDGLLLECNHDTDMLRYGPYPPSLKTRVAGNYGHLNNRQAAEFLGQMDQDRLQHLVVSHVSEQNNQIDLALNELVQVCSKGRDWIQVANQEDGFPWLTIT